MKLAANCKNDSENSIKTKIPSASELIDKMVMGIEPDKRYGGLINQ